MKAGQHRKEIYEIIQDILGRELTTKEFYEVRDRIIAYAEEHGLNTALSRMPPRQFIFTCKDCQKVKSAQGKQQAKLIKGTNKQEIKGSTGVAESMAKSIEMQMERNLLKSKK